MTLIETILKSAEQLPPFPVVMQRVLQIMEDPRTSAQDVVDVIQYDPSITANLLKLCNSAHFGLPRTIHSLRDAVVLMGFDQVLELVLSQASVRFFSTPLRGYGLEAGEKTRQADLALHGEDLTLPPWIGRLREGAQRIVHRLIHHGGSG